MTETSNLQNQPIERLRIANTELVLLGTAHVSRESADAVDELIESGEFDCIAIELDAGRHTALVNPEAYKRLDLVEVFWSGRALLVAANLALSAFQRRLAEQVGIEPGEEMLRADRGATKHAVPLELIDRDVGITLNRCRANLGFWGGCKLITKSMVGIFSEEEIDAKQIEQLKTGGVLRATFGEFADDSPELFESLIAERDLFMATRLQQICRERAPKQLLAVVGAGHLNGMLEALKRTEGETVEQNAATITRLNANPKASIWPKLIGFALTAVLMGGLIFGFSQGFSVGQELLYVYLGLTMAGAFLGAVVAGAHPLAAVIGGLSAPLTILHPAVSSGMVSAVVELWRRKPIVQDFEDLRIDLKKTSGWWKNRVSRTLLVFLLTNFGTAIGAWITTGWFVARLT